MTTFTFLNMFVAIFTNTVVALEADSMKRVSTPTVCLGLHVAGSLCEEVPLRHGCALRETAAGRRIGELRVSRQRWS